MATATQTLHRLTSLAVGRDWDAPVADPRVLQDLEVMDLDRLPWFFKRYAEPLPCLPLPRYLPETTAPAVAVLAGTADVSRSVLDLAQLSRLLHLSAGVVRIQELPYTTWPFRAAGSAGGRFPLELYVAIPEGLPVPAGVHWYDPLAHALVKIGPTPSGDAPAVVVTGVPWRTGWKYRERGYRHVYWDAGTMLSQLLATADSAGLFPALHTRFPDAAVAALVRADGVHEWPVAVVALGEGKPALEATGAAASGEVDAAPVEFPLVTAAQRAGELDVLGPPWDRGAPVDVPLEGDPLEAVVFRRSSQRRMDQTRGLSESLLYTSMHTALRGVAVPHYVVVHDVGGLAAGLYRWPHLSAPRRSGDMRDELYWVCAEQGLPRDAAFVVIAATDVGTLDDREYREAQLAAGLVEGRLHLLAYALGASASGMTFVDSEIPALLGEQVEALLFTCVGVPEYASAPGGPPGAPTTFRKVATRVDDQGRPVERRGARLEAVSEPESAELLPVDCECAAACGEQVLVTAIEYMAAHEEADYVLIRPGHPVDPGSRGARVVITNDRYAVVAEGWALTDDEISDENRARLAELKSTSLFAVSCGCADCEAGPYADAAEVQVTLEEWERLRDARLIKAGHRTNGGSELERNERFVATADPRSDE